MCDEKIKEKLSVSKVGGGARLEHRAPFTVGCQSNKWLLVLIIVMLSAGVILFLTSH